MPVRTRAVDRGIARGRTIVLQLARELDEARLDRGLSYAALGRTLGITGQQVGRICQGRSPKVSVERMVQLFTLVGLDLGARGYPGGQPLRDAGHVALLGRFRAVVHPALVWRTEVPVVAARLEGSRDLRAWDATIGGPGWTYGVEAETHLRDLQAVQRRLALKLRDGGVSGVILLLNDTRHHRHLLAIAGPVLRLAFPTPAKPALWSLRNGEAPASSTMIVL